jgi:hypothetical protein
MPAAVGIVPPRDLRLRLIRRSGRRRVEAEVVFFEPECAGIQGNRKLRFIHGSQNLPSEGLVQLLNRKGQDRVLRNAVGRKRSESHAVATVQVNDLLL